MVVQQSRRSGGHHAQAARHPEVGDQRAAVEVEQQVLGPATHIVHALSRQLGDEAGFDGPSQPRLTQVECGDRATDDGVADAATSGLYFG